MREADDDDGRGGARTSSPRSNAHGALFAVNYGYTGYPLVRHMRAMVARGDLGKVRLVKAEFAHGFHADAD